MYILIYCDTTVHHNKLNEKYSALHPVRMIMAIKRDLEVEVEVELEGEVEVEVEVELELDIGGDVVGILGVINKVLTSAILNGYAAVNRSVEMLVESIRILTTNFENVEMFITNFGNVDN